MAKLKSLFTFISNLFTPNKKSVESSSQVENLIIPTTDKIKQIEVVTPISVECRTHKKYLDTIVDFKPFISESQAN